MVDPVAAATLAHAAGTNARAARQNARSTASNVILVSTSTPRRGGGYKIEFAIYNKSSVGIADIVVDVHMLAGDLELNGELGTHGTWSARRALEAGGTLTGALRHTARFGEATFELDDDVLSSFTSTLSWCDDQRRKWSRVDGKPARRVLPISRQRPNPR